MSDLLPANAAEQERDISRAIERAFQVTTPIRSVWNPDTCPANMLAWLAWAFSVDDWGANWSETQKRDVIKRSVAVHRYKGTIGAVKEALAALGVDAQIQEWFNQVPPGNPYTFKISLQSTQADVTVSSIQNLLRVVFSTKNLRSHLDSVQVNVQSVADVYLGAVASLGHEYTVEAGQGGSIIINGNVVNIGE